MNWFKKDEEVSEEVSEDVSAEAEVVIPEVVEEKPKKSKKKKKVKGKICKTFVRKGKFVNKVLHTEDGELVQYEDKSVAAKVAVWYGHRAVEKDGFWVITQ